MTFWLFIIAVALIFGRKAAATVLLLYLALIVLVITCAVVLTR